jgi:hypothetical protein
VRFCTPSRPKVKGQKCKDQGSRQKGKIKKAESSPAKTASILSAYRDEIFGDFKNRTQYFQD